MANYLIIPAGGVGAMRQKIYTLGLKISCKREQIFMERFVHGSLSRIWSGACGNTRPRGSPRIKMSKRILFVSVPAHCQNKARFPSAQSRASWVKGYLPYLLHRQRELESATRGVWAREHDGFDIVFSIQLIYTSCSSKKAIRNDQLRCSGRSDELN